MGILEEEPWRLDSLAVPKRRQATADKLWITAAKDADVAGLHHPDNKGSGKA